MTAMTRGSASNSPFRYGNPTIDCDGAQLRGQCRQLATVVSISGDVTDANLDGLIERVRHYILAEKPLILDLGGVCSFAARGVSLFGAVDDQCEAAGVEWSFVTSQSVSRTLRLLGDQNTYPSADSVPEALHHFSDVMSERRRLLPILGKSA
ncbi:MAG TPA: STAS domain-containing protein [Mycobacterium sp.]|jgi:anti-anti-sigma regulatory factor|nr:STAS domain-containing protein [Mycobacterium sp.]